MKKLKWLYPGMLIKRWISLTVFGIVMISMGFVIVIFERTPENKATAGFIIILGIMDKLELLQFPYSLACNL